MPDATSHTSPRSRHDNPSATGQRASRQADARPTKAQVRSTFANSRRAASPNENRLYEYPSLIAQPVLDRRPSQGSSLRDRQTSSTRQVGLIVMLTSSLALTVLGVIMVFSATSASSISAVTNSGGQATLLSFSVALRHFAWVIISAVVGFVIALIPARWLEMMCYWIFGLCIGLQGATALFGVEVSGNRNWLNLGFAQIQPSELLKLGMIVCLAHVLARLHHKDFASWRALALPMCVFLAAVLAVAAGGDMGTALIFVLIGGGMFWVSGLDRKIIAIVFLLGALFAGILVAIRPSRLRRVIDYIDNFFAVPDVVDPTQSEFAQFAFGSGGWLGVGLGAGKEKWRDLAEAQTDYIYAVVGEELGLLGAVVVLVLFLALGWAFITISLSMRNRYAQLAVVGAALWICGQGLANMSVVTGLLPVFGVPLPFLSQGGSSMLGVYSMLGIVVGLVRSADDHQGADRRNARLIRRSTAVFKART
ncbi:MAG: FtsW/RodA/SpoVE family cell cycle protein [Actinomycetaceae bacterium]|nr:FtsW/RodA/SpoVE family cell cycle protein [Arcanobacterium sp.]MDD7505422.1 FtsW/RodA/SpoVE family cell cycle protein [Actinomycetaceae bacterium]MDY6142769.1 FtsW/RodA/SpoVE family cell cycle protein [Arcanobacterium sp.]